MVGWTLDQADVDSPLKRFAQRYAYNGLDQIALRDLGFGMRQVQPKPIVQAVQPPRAITPPPKRPLQESPRPRPPSPSYKRPRAQSPPRRFTPPRTDRVPSNPPRNFRDRTSRDRSPVGYRRDGGSIPPQQSYGGYGPPPGVPQSNGYRAPSGSYGPELPPPLSRFIGSLPSERSFDGESTCGWN